MQFYRNLVFAIGATILLFGISEAKITIIPSGSTLQLQCKNNANVTIVYRGGVKETSSSSSRTIRTDADTATYGCSDSSVSSDSTFVFIRACRNCVEVDSGTMAGLVIGDLIATFLIAVAVYCVATPPKVKIHRAFDRQALIPNDATGALYSGIKQGDRQEYSKLKVKSKE
ncbi:T-cell surface glycoprotein CD3 delta chain-like isoform X1 [Amblyraja radiata]|uniref:T-cell surface glycoprotein CD3 delta chain-like isoform X1 n=1 Tax=Amblyraja radiata TaxID=386614 RepID=UPI001401DF85|nr:T-cell surface glycoprotein CD3 delta chain-like isoform X1 [Amblyraja radiata]